MTTVILSQIKLIAEGLDDGKKKAESLIQPFF
jgi:hypothetical protein